MLELIFLAKFGRTLADMASMKGRSKWWAAMGVAAWIVGEFLGVIGGAVMGLDLLAYVTGILCAAVCATIAYFVVKNLEDHLGPNTIAVDKGARSPSGAPTAGTNLSYDNDQ